MADPRIEPAPEPLAPELAATLARLPREWGEPFALFTTLGRDPRLLARFMAGAVSYLDPSHIGLREREVLLLRTTARARCEYEWGLRMHFFAQEAGISAEQAHASVHGDVRSPCWRDDDRILIELADALHDDCTVSDDLWDRLAARFSEEAIMQMLMLAGYYRGIAYIANALRLPLESGRALSFPER